jgi:hypothetical protein
VVSRAAYFGHSLLPTVKRSPRAKDQPLPGRFISRVELSPCLPESRRRCPLLAQAARIAPSPPTARCASQNCAARLPSTRRGRVAVTARGSPAGGGPHRGRVREELRPPVAAAQGALARGGPPTEALVTRSRQEELLLYGHTPPCFPCRRKEEEGGTLHRFTAWPSAA